MSVTQPQTETRSLWTLDPAHTLVEFSAKHMMVTTVKGHFATVEGSFETDEADLSQTRIQAEIDATSIDTHNEQRDGHLRSADFLDAENFPKITFESTRVDVLSEDHVHVVGDLTIRGVTKEVVLDTEINGRGKSPFGTEVAGITAQTKINRKDFGLTWNVGLETGGVLVSDTIKIQLEIEAVKQTGEQN